MRTNHSNGCHDKRNHFRWSIESTEIGSGFYPTMQFLLGVQSSDDMIPQAPLQLYFSIFNPLLILSPTLKFSSWERECSGNAMQWGDCQRCGFSRAAQLWNLQLVSLSSTLVNLQRCGSLQSMDVFEDDVGCKASMWSEAWWACCHQRIPSFANIQLLFAWGRPLVQCTGDR